VASTEGQDPKASFDSIYTEPTPHRYFAEMRRLGYQIGEQARPYCLAAARVLEKKLPAWPVQVLDLGCSYGVGAAFVKHGCTFEELVSFYASRAPKDYSGCAAATRAWLNVVPPLLDARVTGLDISEPAIRFAEEAGLLSRGLARDYETTLPTEEERDLLRSCNMLMCTGALGYITEKTLSRILPELGRYAPGGQGALAVITVLRMYDVAPVRDCFVTLGYEFERVEDVRLPQRAFVDEREQREVLERLSDRGVEVDGWESLGVLYADLYIAAWPSLMAPLRDAMDIARGKVKQSLFAPQIEVASARQRAEYDIKSVFPTNGT
jgi:SAM-dependent methyltransferase